MNRIQSVIIITICCLFSYNTSAQHQVDSTHLSIPEKDVADVFKSVFKIKSDTSKPAKPNSLAILPSIGYNPSFGYIIGAKATSSFIKGHPKNTDYSTIGMEALYTSKGIVTLQAIHNIFTTGNQLNFQGNWQFSKFSIFDYGIGSRAGKTDGGDSITIEFPIRYNYIRLNEKLYKKIGSKLYAGGGFSYNRYTDIKDEQLSDSLNTPHYTYSTDNGYDIKHYSANGFVFSLQYNTREHPVRAYGGIYADLNIRLNRKWVGSTKNGTQISYDFRKYWSLSKRNPAHVIAVWHFATYALGGSVPYLDLPSTGSDNYKRSGRSYTISRFKGPSFAYFETEYRFPILRNKLLSGVCFFNAESAANADGKELFKVWDKGAGVGLRILFKKQSRSALCLDFAKGDVGPWAIFLGLNEAF